MIHCEVNCQSNFCLCGFRTRETKNIDSQEIFNYFEIDVGNADLRPLACGMVIRKLTFILPIYVSFVIRLIRRYRQRRRKNIKLPPQRKRDMLSSCCDTRAQFIRNWIWKNFPHSFLLVRDMRASTDRRMPENIFISRWMEWKYM